MTRFLRDGLGCWKHNFIFRIIITKVTSDPHVNLEAIEKFKERNLPYFHNSAITMFSILVFIVLLVLQITAFIYSIFELNWHFPPHMVIFSPCFKKCFCCGKTYIIQNLPL